MLCLIPSITESLYHALKIVWALHVVLLTGLNPILKTECSLFIMVFLHLAPSCILEFLRAPFWPLFCSHYYASSGDNSYQAWGVISFYADDTQIYLPLRKNDQRGLGSLNPCLSDIKSWFSSFFYI